MKPLSWRNRVRELRQVSSEELQRNPHNFREHPEQQRAALRGILDEIGIAGVLLAYVDQEWGLTLIDGHARHEEGGTWPVVILDVNRSEANLLLATHDPLAALATTNATRLDGLLRNVTTGEPAVLEILALIAENAGVVPPSEPDELADILEGSKPDHLGKQHTCPACNHTWVE
jgi:hypothetical protein